MGGGFFPWVAAASARIKKSQFRLNIDNHQVGKKSPQGINL